MEDVMGDAMEDVERLDGIMDANASCSKSSTLLPTLLSLLLIYSFATSYHSPYKQLRFWEASQKGDKPICIECTPSF